MSSYKEISIGIDLGTTNTCTAYYSNGTVSILYDSCGQRRTPSYLLYCKKEKEPGVGYYAKMFFRPECSVYEVKRLIGRTFDDHELQENLKHLTYTVEDHLNEPVVVIKDPEINLRKTPVELYTALLSQVKFDVEAKFGKEHKINVVVSVPANFNVSQREATIEAANKAGFTVLKILNEPTAAALCFLLYHSKYYSVDGDHFLVYDLGGGTFDVAILKKTEQNIEIVAADGDNHLGGHDFDNLIVDYLCSVLIKDYSFDPKTNKKKLRQLRNAIEEAKETLSALEKTEVCLEEFVPGLEYVELELSREHFEKIAAKLFKKTIDIMDICLKSCNLSKSNIKEVILAGGSTRIPKIQELISNYFDGKSLNRFVRPEECVAEGAAIQAAMLYIDPRQKILGRTDIFDVTPLSLGLSIYPNKMYTCIKLHTVIPVSMTKIYVTTKDRQKSMSFNVYEGERTDVRKNRHLGTLTIEDLTPAPPGQCEVVFTMKIGQNGILTVTAKEVSKSNSKMLEIMYARGSTRTDFDIRNALKEAEDNKLQDLKYLICAKLEKYVKNYCQAILYNISKKFLTKSHKEIHVWCQTINNELEEIDLDNDVDIKNLIRLIESKCKFIVAEYKFELMPEPCVF